MKKAWVKYTIEIFLFLAILIASFLVFKPLHTYIQFRITEGRSYLFGNLEKQTGLRISYKSMSPSIFRMISFKDLRIYNETSNETVAFFQEISLDYNFFDFIRGKGIQSIRSLLLKNGSVNIDTVYDYRLIELLAQSNAEKKTENDSLLPFDLNALFANMRFAIHLQNVHLSWKDNLAAVSVHVIAANLRLDSDVLQVTGQIKAGYTNSNGAIKDVSAAVNINGSYNINEESGAASVTVGTLDGKSFLAKDIHLFAAYKNDEVSVSTLQSLQPVTLAASWNIVSNMFQMQFDCEDFYPFSTVTLYNPPPILRKMQDLHLSGSAGVKYIAADDFNWESNFEIDIPSITVSNFSMKKSVVAVEASGNEKLIDVKSISVKGTQADISGQLTLDIKNKIPEGVFDIRRLRLPHGPVIRTTVSIYADKRDIICAMPTFVVGRGQLNNITLTARPYRKKIEFALSANDKGGQFGFDGVYVYAAGKKLKDFLEIHGALDSVELGNIYQMFVPENMRTKQLYSIVDTFQLTTEFYVSTNFKDFSYNVIKVVAASKTVEGLYGLFSIAGNQNIVSLKDINFFYNSLNIRGGADINLENPKSIFFESYLAVNTVAYHFNGIIENKTVNIYGDYGLVINAMRGKHNSLLAKIQMSDLPLPLLPVYLSVDTDFEYRTQKEWSAAVHHLELTYDTNLGAASTTLRLTAEGDIKPERSVFPIVKFENEYSSLTGSAKAEINRDEKTAAEEFSLFLDLMSQDKTERLSAQAAFTLPDARYSRGRIDFDSVALNRFFPAQSEKNRVDARLDFFTEPDNVFVQFNLRDLDALVRGKPLKAYGIFLFDQDMISVTNTGFSLANHQMSDISLFAFLKESQATISADYSGKIAGLDTSANIMLIADMPKGETSLGVGGYIQNAMSNFSLDITLNNFKFGESMAKKAIPATVLRESGVTAFYAGSAEEVTGFIMDDGTISLNVAQSLPIHLSADGLVTSEKIDLAVQNLFVDVGFVSSFFKNDFIEFTQGMLTGDINVRGTGLDPEFYGNLVLTDAFGNSPGFAPEIFGPANFTIVAKDNMLIVPYMVIPGPTGSLWGKATAEFLGWNISEILVDCGTLGSQQGIMRTQNPIFYADGKTGANIRIAIYPGKLVEINGQASFDDGYFTLPFKEMEEFFASQDITGGDFKMNLAIDVGQKTEFRWPTSTVPIIRTLLAADDPVVMIVDTSKNLFVVKGDLEMRGGEVFYIKRNFYIRQGNLVFSDSIYGAIPRISVRAEIRDQDKDNNPVRIMLSAQDQLITEFMPTLESEPSLSNTELMQLLGQVALADVSKDTLLKEVLISSTDVLAQLGIFRRAETKIRDFFKLDVFSFRTLVVQNAIFGNLFQNSSAKALTIGNYFDNTSVYIGKYFGSAIYLDALLHMSYYDRDNLSGGQVSPKKNTYGSLLFVPEVGLEMTTPFFTLRWSVAPTQVDNLFVGDSALKLLWEFSY